MRLRALALLLLLAAAPAWAQAPAPVPAPAQAQDEEVQSRFIWGLLISTAVSKLAGMSWDWFAGWLKKSNPEVPANAQPNLAADSGAQVRPRSSTAVTARGEGSVAGTPSAPFSGERGRENYQGFHIAIIVPSADEKEFSFRPISTGFKTGERFKLRVVTTFAGELTLENINPSNERRHIYPPKSDLVVALQAGRATFLPLGKDEYFQFAKATGREQLIVNLADPRAVGPAASQAQVYRQDVKYGSNFLQQVASGTYPRISQSIELQHSAN